MANIVLAAEEAAPHGAREPNATQTSVEHHGGGEFPPFQTENFVPQLVWLALTFGLLYLLMSRIALPRIGSILHDRESRIESDLFASRELQAKAQEAAAAHDETLRVTKAQAQDIGRAAQQQAATETATRRASEEAAFAEKVAAAEAQILAAKSEALSNVEAIATDAAGAILEKLTGARFAAETLQGEYRNIKAS
ncbi:ATP synthase subunit b 2 [Methylosinus sp. C49]|jgi:F-type H+-transporting ATPase subunit b|uniref:F0F1 ATP synthase subunit B family protein n=1 Tax=Methylosinus sp. C49 TaxID=2699395 RepID=UPI001366FE6B|nr:ATPase [Methylosinus sp. C49]BBU60861.1 ATP synthase subunit b 2 [Methylosinus sp. C49]